MRGATLLERIFHYFGFHFTKSRLGMVALTNRYFRLQDRDLLSVECVFCGEVVENPFHVSKVKYESRTS